MPAVQIEADRIEYTAGVAVAEGSVQVRMGEETLSGRRATWDGTTLVVEDGEYHRPDGVLQFDRAEVTPQGATAVLLDARATAGGTTVAASEVSLGEGRWTARSADVVPCACADGGPPALTFTAGAITVVPAKVVILHGGVARVFGVPILPVPWARIPLDPHRFRLLLPEVGWGEEGVNARIQGRGGVGDWTFQGGPAWREDRGARGELLVTGPVGTAQGELGWDALEERVRGLGVSRGGVVKPVRTAWDVTAPSDPDYAADYAVDYVARGVAWRDSRAVFALGPERLDGWLPDDGSGGTLLRERAAWEVGRGHAASITPRLGIAAVGTADSLGGLGEAGVGARAAGGTPWLAAEVRGDAAARWGIGTGEGTAWTPVTAPWADGIAAVAAGADPWGEGLADGALPSWGAGGTGVGGVAAGSLAVPIWSTAGRARIQWWPGVRAEARGSWEDAWTGAVRAGPALRATTSLATGGVAFDAAILQDGDGWRPAGTLDVHLTKLSLRLQADPAVQGGEARWMPGPLTLVAGGVHADALALAWGDAGLAWGRLRTGAGASWNVGENALSGASVRLGYDDGCASATVTARFAPDRLRPDLGLAVTLRR